MAKITPDDLGVAYADGRLRFAPEPGGGSPACWIDDNWFFFAGQEGDLVGAEDYIARTPVDDMLREAADAIDSWDEDPAFADEHAFYAAVMRECMLKRAQDLSERAKLLRRVTDFLSVNEQYGDDWCDEINAVAACADECMLSAQAWNGHAERLREEVSSDETA